MFSRRHAQGFLLIAVALMLPAKALAQSQEAEPPGWRNAKAAVDAIVAGRRLCEVQPDNRLRYIGPIDAGLADCLAGLADRRGVTLVISSQGGDAETGIDVGYLLQGRDWTAEVHGLCASACANYILPAMRAVAVEPFSAVLLHGGADDEELIYEAAVDQILARQRAVAPDVDEATVAEARVFTRNLVRRIVAAHRRYGEDLGVASAWFTLAGFPTPEGGYGPMGFALADPAFAAAALGRVRVRSFWFPTTDEDRRLLFSLFPDTHIVVRETTEIAARL
ncbi:hypothetical protein ABE453_15745 [Brevundimonas diminuta]|uniref:hypothetical protein n=1 Tax=Brevundimonas diminuta TaxID=293 RepID=UPI00320A8C93